MSRKGASAPFFFAWRPWRLVDRPIALWALLCVPRTAAARKAAPLEFHQSIEDIHSEPDTKNVGYGELRRGVNVQWGVQTWV